MHFFSRPCFNAVAALLALVLVSACVKPVDPLSGRITEVEVFVPEGQVAVLDWATANAEAARDGYLYTRPPFSSTKPTREETLARAEADESNARYLTHLNSLEVVQRVQEISIPKIEAQILKDANNPFRYPRASGKVLVNAGDQPAFLLRVKPSRILLVPKTHDQKSTGAVAGEVAISMIFGASASPSFPRLSGTYELVDLQTGTVVQRGAFRDRYNPKAHGRFEMNNLQFVARAILMAVARDQGQGN